VCAWRRTFRTSASRNPNRARKVLTGTLNKHHPDSPNGHGDDNLNTSGNPGFESILNVRLSRRDILKGGLGATPMDRPEWTGVNPVTGDVYVTLTNNTGNRGKTGGQPLDPANPRYSSDAKGTATNTGNVNGHIPPPLHQRQDGRFRHQCPRLFLAACRTFPVAPTGKVRQAARALEWFAAPA